MRKVDKFKMLYLTCDASDPLKYVSSGHLLSQENFVHPRRNLDTYVFIVVLEGVLHIRQQEREYDVGPNQFIILYAGMDHGGTIASDGLLSYHWVHFTIPESSARYAQAESATLCQKMLGFRGSDTYVMPEYGSLEITSQVTLLFSQLLNAAKRIGRPCPLLHFALSQMVLQLSFLLLINPDIDRYPLHVARTIDWVSNNYMLPLTVREIAEHFHYHPSYISSEMKKYTGLTLIAYIHSVRMNVAKSLLANYDIPVAEVARQSGYTDEKYFIRVFRRTQGITPGEYRKSFALRKQID